MVAEWSPDGGRIAVGYHDGSCKVWDVSTLQQAPRSQEDAGLLSTHLEASNAEAIGKELLTFSAHTAEVLDLTWSPDGTRIVSGDESGLVKIWDAVTGTEVRSFRVPSAAWGVNWSPDGDRIIITGLFNTPVIRQAWQSTDELIAYATECCVQRELTDAERQQFGLPPRPESR
jgi:WD40 repeat protein